VQRSGHGQIYGTCGFLRGTEENDGKSRLDSQCPGLANMKVLTGRDGM
jgi:hypothetical protein